MPCEEEAHRARGPLMSCGMFPELEFGLDVGLATAPHVLTGATLDDQIRLHLGHLRRCAEQPVMETVSFDVLRNDDTRGHAMSIAATRRVPISIHIPLALMNERATLRMPKCNRH